MKHTGNEKYGGDINLTKIENCGEKNYTEIYSLSTQEKTCQK